MASILLLRRYERHQGQQTPLDNAANAQKDDMIVTLSAPLAQI